MMWFMTKKLDTPRESPWGTTTREQKIGLEFEKSEYDEINSLVITNIIGLHQLGILKVSIFYLNMLKFNKIASAMMRP